MEENTEAPQVEKKTKYSPRKMLRNGAILVLALTFGYIHRNYIITLFENGRHFSHLSTLEREMSLRTEMGFYYSYYKTVVEERPLTVALARLLHDTRAEHPRTVNALARFNILPEVVLGALYRYLEPILNSTRKDCHMVARGGGLQPVQSCNTLAEPMIFYLEAVWWFSAIMIVAVFVHACSLSESILGGIIAVTQYFANHADCTRVQWAPNERENFAAPLFFLQTWLLTLHLRDKDKRTSFYIQVCLFGVNCLCLLFWQFSQFIFLTQIAIFFVMEQLKIIDLKTLCVFLHSHFCGLHTAVLLLQGNDMLKSSLFTSFFICIAAYCLCFSSLRITINKTDDLLVEIWLVLLRISLVIFTSLYLKKAISDFLIVDEDSHIWDILLSKLSDYKNFHTMIYTCSDVFGFLPFKTALDLSITLLIPTVMLVIVFLCIYHVKQGVRHVDQILNPAQRSVVKLITDKSRTVNKSALNTEYANVESIEELLSINKNNTDSIDNTNAHEEATAERKAKTETQEDNADIDKKESNVTNKKENADHRQGDLDQIDVKYVDEYVDTWIEFLRGVKIDAAVFYNVSQMLVFGVMAYFIMRLKLLFVTQMCVVSALIANTKYHIKPATGVMRIFWIACFCYVLLLMADNVSVELSYLGEFNDPSQEELLEWIVRDTASTAAFAGSMPVLASVLLSTRRPVVAHPHYENAEARHRAYTVYKTYGRFSPQELYEELTKLQVAYLIVETQLCYGTSSQGCSFLKIWETVSQPGDTRPQLCGGLLTRPVDHFYRVFTNDRYSVFLVHDLSVSYMPRCFDT